MAKKKVECEDCCGAGYEPQYIKSPDGFLNWNGIDKKCETCNGTGKMIYGVLRKCVKKQTTSIQVIHK